MGYMNIISLEKMLVFLIIHVINIVCVLVYFTIF